MKPLHQLNVINNLIYALADVIETNLMDLEAESTASMENGSVTNPSATSTQPFMDCDA